MRGMLPGLQLALSCPLPSNDTPRLSNKRARHREQRAITHVPSNSVAEDLNGFGTSKLCFNDMVLRTHRISDVAEPVPAEQNVTQSRLRGPSAVNGPGVPRPFWRPPEPRSVLVGCLMEISVP